MGLDFLRLRGPAAWRKQWDKGCEDLRTPDLFDPVFGHPRRVITVDAQSAMPNVDEECVVRPDGARLTVWKGHACLGVVENPAVELIEALYGAGGLALGTVTAIGSFGDTFDVVLR